MLSVTAIAPPSTSGGAEIGGATGGKRSGSIIAPIVGGCVGGALGILAIGVFAFYILLRYRKAGQGSRNLKYGVSGTGSAERSTSISHKGASIGMLYVSISELLHRATCGLTRWLLHALLRMRMTREHSRRPSLPLMPPRSKFRAFLLSEGQPQGSVTSP